MKIITKDQIATIIGAVLLMTVIAHYDDFLPYRWRTFTAADGSFFVQFPSKPKTDELQVQLANGVTTTAHEVSSQLRNGAVYACSYFEDPRLANGSIEVALNSARDGSVSKVQGTVISERHLEVDGYPAEDVEVHARGNSLTSMRLIAAGRRMFMLVVVEGDRDQPNSKNDRKFFDSINFRK